MNEYNRLYKCIVVGDEGCGKTELVTNFSYSICPGEEIFTIGVEFGQKEIIFLKNKQKIRLTIFGIASQDKFYFLRRLYYAGSKGAILVFDLTNRESFDHIPKWIEDIRKNVGDIPMLLLGNTGFASNLETDRAISKEEERNLAKELGISAFYEGSVLSGEGLGDPFAIISCLMLKITVPNEFLSGNHIIKRLPIKKVKEEDEDDENDEEMEDDDDYVICRLCGKQFGSGGGDDYIGICYDCIEANNVDVDKLWDDIENEIFVRDHEIKRRYKKTDPGLQQIDTFKYIDSEAMDDEIVDDDTIVQCRICNEDFGIGYGDDFLELCYHCIKTNRIDADLIWDEIEEGKISENDSYETMEKYKKTSLDEETEDDDDYVICRLCAMQFGSGGGDDYVEICYDCIETYNIDVDLIWDDIEEGQISENDVYETMEKYKKTSLDDEEIEDDDLVR